MKGEANRGRQATPTGEVGRRSFANYLLGGGLLTTIASALVPLINFIIPPQAKEASVKSIEAARVGEMAPDSGKVFRFGTRPAILIRKQDGGYVAFDAVCTHLNCTVQYRSDFHHIWCACHNGQFDLNGQVIAGPPPRPLEAFDVDIVGETIIVSRKA